MNSGPFEDLEEAEKSFTIINTRCN